jgi:hypothetical protein
LSAESWVAIPLGAILLFILSRCPILTRARANEKARGFDPQASCAILVEAVVLSQSVVDRRRLLSAAACGRHVFDVPGPLTCHQLTQTGAQRNGSIWRCLAMPDVTCAENSGTDDADSSCLSWKVLVCPTTPSQSRKAQTKRKAFPPGIAAAFNHRDAWGKVILSQGSELFFDLDLHTHHHWPKFRDRDYPIIHD